MAARTQTKPTTPDQTKTASRAKDKAGRSGRMGKPSRSEGGQLRRSRQRKTRSAAGVEESRLLKPFQLVDAPLEHAIFWGAVAAIQRRVGMAGVTGQFHRCARHAR